MLGLDQGCPGLELCGARCSLVEAVYHGGGLRLELLRFRLNEVPAERGRGGVKRALEVEREKERERERVPTGMG